MGIYQSAILALSPLAAYDLEGGSTTEADITGNSRTGTWNTAPSSTTGLAAQLGSASVLTGSQYSEVNNTFLQPSMSAVSVVGWFKTSVSGSYLEINTCANTAASTWKWLMRISSGTTMEWIVNVNGSLVSSNAGSPVPSANLADGNPHLMVGTYDGTNMVCYIDAVQVGVTNAPGSIPSIGAGSMVIGSRPDHIEKFSGTLDAQAVFNYALTQTQINSIYAAGRTTIGPINKLTNRSALFAASTR